MRACVRACVHACVRACVRGRKAARQAGASKRAGKRAGKRAVICPSHYAKPSLRLGAAGLRSTGHTCPPIRQRFGRGAAQAASCRPPASAIGQHCQCAAQHWRARVGRRPKGAHESRVPVPVSPAWTGQSPSPLTYGSRCVPYAKEETLVP